MPFVEDKSCEILVENDLNLCPMVMGKIKNQRSIKTELEWEYFIEGMGDMPVDANGEERFIPKLELTTFYKAFFQLHSSDRFFYSYVLLGKDGKINPDQYRIAKVMLPYIREKGYDIKSYYMAFDWDNPKHGGWGDTEEDIYLNQKEFIDVFNFACDDRKLLGNFQASYFTRGGARWIYRLKTPACPEVTESKLKWISHQLNERGVITDTGTEDWTRLMRLPSVTREGRPTCNELYFNYNFKKQINAFDDLEILDVEDLELQDEPTFLDITKIPSISPSLSVAMKMQGARSAYSADAQFPDKPTDDEVRRLLEVASGHQSKFYTQAKKILVGREYYASIFEDAPLTNAGKGDRNVTISKAVGSVTGMLFNYIKGFSPAHTYSLLYYKVLDFDQDSENAGQTWDEILWDMCKRFFEGEYRQNLDKKIVKKKEEQVYETVCEKASHGMMEWVSEEYLEENKEMVADEEGRIEFVRRHAIAAWAGKFYFLMGKDGRYINREIARSALKAEILNQDLEALVPLTYQTDNGLTKNFTIDDLIARHSVNVDEIISKPFQEGGYIHNINKSGSQLYMPLTRRNPKLIPEFNDHVDKWLRALGGRRYEDLKRWISWALAVDEGPTCALSIEGPSKIGKDLFAHGLAECFEYKSFATSTDITSDYNDGLLKSSILWVNEEWGKMKGETITGKFREYVTAVQMSVNKKFGAKSTVINSIRILMTANNRNLALGIGANAHMSPSDAEAINERLYHLVCDHGARKYLEALGGTSFTGKVGARWVQGRSEPSNFVVAKHFLWLYSNRNSATKGSRLLMEGPGDKNIVFDMQNSTGANAQVNMSLLNIFSRVYKTSRPKESYLLDKEVGAFFVTPLYVRDAMTKDDSVSKLPSINSIAQSLDGLRHPKCKGEPILLKGKEDFGKMFWYRISLEALTHFAMKNGYRTAEIGEMARLEKSSDAVDFSSDGIRQTEIPEAKCNITKFKSGILRKKG